MLSQIIEDAPSSTTLKLLPLPDFVASNHAIYPTSIDPSHDGVAYPPEPAAFDIHTGCELPPIQWSSSSLAGALGPLDQENANPPEPSTSLAHLQAETSSLDVAASLKPQELKSRTSSPVSLQAFLPSLDWEDSLGEVASSSISSRLEDAESYEHASLQQLLELIDSPSYAPGWAFEAAC